MNENKRKTRLTDRDLLVAKWIAEQQAVRLDTVGLLLANWGNETVPRNIRRLAQRWESKGLIKRDRILVTTPMVLWPTALAMKLTDLQDKRTEKSPSISSLHHTLAVSRVRVEYEKHGAIWLCERALRNHYPNQHLADGLAQLPNSRILVEVDRTRKKAERLRAIMAINARTPGITAVHYWTTHELITFVSEQVQLLDESVRSRIVIYELPKEVQ